MIVITITCVVLILAVFAFGLAAALAAIEAIHDGLVAGADLTERESDA